MNPLFKGYEGAPWLDHIEADPDKESLEALAAVAAEEAKYPMAPGNELTFFDHVTPGDMTLDNIKTAGGQQMWLYKPKTCKSPKIFYYIHGGGFMRGNGPWCRHNAIALVRALNIPVAAIEYHYTPEFKYPVALDDCNDGLNYLTDTLKYDMKNVIVGGESAGGTYTMALALRLKRLGKPLPCALVNMSAYLDLSLKGPSYSANLGVDPTFTDSLEPSIPYYLDDLSKVCDPEVSPIYGDYSGFPPTFYAVDDTEIFLSDALIGCDRLYKLGIPCHALVTHGLVHVYEFEEVNIKESRHFYAELKKFLQQNKIL